MAKKKSYQDNKMLFSNKTRKRLQHVEDKEPAICVICVNKVLQGTNKKKNIEIFGVCFIVTCL